MAKNTTNTTANTNNWGKKLNTAPNFKKTSALENGQSISGTLVAFQQSKIPATGKEVTNLIMRDANGEPFNLAPSGNIVYAIRDGLLKVGTTYTFVREGTGKTKMGSARGIFGIYEVENNNNDSI